jgi:hypothetical protein
MIRHGEESLGWTLAPDCELALITLIHLDRDRLRRIVRDEAAALRFAENALRAGEHLPRRCARAFLRQLWISAMARRN